MRDLGRLQADGLELEARGRPVRCVVFYLVVLAPRVDATLCGYLEALPLYGREPHLASVAPIAGPVGGATAGEAVGAVWVVSLLRTCRDTLGYLGPIVNEILRLPP